MVAPARERQNVLVEATEELLERLWVVGRRTRQARPHLRRTRPADRRRRGIEEPLHEEVDRPVPQLSHCLAVERKPIRPSRVTHTPSIPRPFFPPLS